MNRFLRPWPFSIILALLLGGCGPAAPVTDWRLLIELPDVELPARLRLSPDGETAWFENGRERVSVPSVTRDGNRLRLRFPAFNSSFDLEQSGDRLSGTLTLVKRGYEQVMPVTGAPHPGYRFVPEPEPAVDVTGRWAVDFTDDEGKVTAAVGEFDQQGSTVTGTFLTPTGDYRFLAGEVDGRRLMLSTFDGAHAFVFSASVGADGRLQGDFWSGTKWHERWRAGRDFEARLPDAFALTYLREDYDRFEFVFPDLDGNAVSLNDDKYRGKVVLVVLSGTWCPNCADEAEFLSRYYRENRDRGLEIIVLLFERFDDFGRASAQGKAWVDKHDIDFDVLVAGVSDKDLAAEKLPMLNHVLAYPTTVFIGRDGEVKHIHTGFTGPGTGAYYEDFKREFGERMDGLLDSHLADAR